MNNPTPPRQAIALKYDGSHALTLTAKGDDELAEAILQDVAQLANPIPDTLNRRPTAREHSIAHRRQRCRRRGMRDQRPVERA